MNEKDQSVTASWLNVLAGIWLIIAPAVLSYPAGSAARTNDIWVGVIVGMLALIRAFSPASTYRLSWVNAAAGVWLIASPFVLNYGGATPFWNDIVLGFVILTDAIWNAAAGAKLASKRAGYRTQRS